MKKSNILLILFIFTFISCKHKKETLIAFSYPDDREGWGKILREEVFNEFNLYAEDGMQLLAKGANGDKQIQVEVLNDFYNWDVDILILFPSDSSYLKKTIEKFYAKGIPVIILDRKINTDKFTQFIGHDNKSIGEQAGQYSAKLLDYKGSILEIHGDKSSSTAFDRSIGFHNIIDKHPNIQIEHEYDGYWRKEEVQTRLDSILNTGYIPDLIYSHNDNMAKWALPICKKYDIKPLFVGIDGLPDKGEGLEMISENKLDATFYNRPGGDVAVQNAFKILKGNKLPKYEMLASFPIDKNNINSIKLGFKQYNSQIEDIKTLQSKLNISVFQFKRQRVVLYISLAIILLLSMGIILLYLFLRQKRKYIQIIEKQNRIIEGHLEEESSLLEELSCQNESLELYKSKLEQLVKEKTDNLQVALGKANESDKLKSSFLNNFSHEVRTPLNSVIGFCDVLFDRNLNEIQIKLCLKNIKASGKELLKLINNLLEVSIISTSKIEISNNTIVVNDLLKDLYEHCLIECDEILEKKNEKIEFYLKQNDLINKTINSDPKRLKQLVTYLVDNAIKYTHTGFVEIGGLELNGDNIRLYVKDTGIGIEESNHNKIFEKFIKLDSSNDILYRGMGIGLFIANNLAEILNTKIQLNSTSGKGSTFYFDIPVLNGASSM